MIGTECPVESRARLLFCHNAPLHCLKRFANVNKNIRRMGPLDITLSGHLGNVSQLEPVGGITGLPSSRVGKLMRQGDSRPFAHDVRPTSAVNSVKGSEYRDRPHGAISLVNQGNLDPSHTRRVVSCSFTQLEKVAQQLQTRIADLRIMTRMPLILPGCGFLEAFCRSTNVRCRQGSSRLALNFIGVMCVETHWCPCVLLATTYAT